MDLYICERCGEECLIEYDTHERYWPDAWCDNCNDYPGGWSEAVNDIHIEAWGAAADWAHDRAKDAQMED